MQNPLRSAMNSAFSPGQPRRTAHLARSYHYRRPILLKVTLTHQSKLIAHAPCSGLVQSIFSSPARLRSGSQFTKPQAERWLAKFIEEQSINDASHLARSQSPVLTFGLSARGWREHHLIVNKKRSSQSSMSFNFESKRIGSSAETTFGRNHHRCASIPVVS
jgi:hypothetical protein